MDRRMLLRSGLLVAGGAAAGAAAMEAPRLRPSAHLPFDGGYARAAGRSDYDVQGGTTVTWQVQTDEPVVAFTFDDGPGPKWTSMVLDTLDQHAVPATFFLVGKHLAAHGDLVEGRLDRHEVGSHSWWHPDLARLSAPSVERQLSRTHDVIRQVTGRETQLFRPPYGHLGGSRLMAADKMAYKLVLWSHQMAESRYLKDRAGQVEEIINNVRPGPDRPGT